MATQKSKVSAKEAWGVREEGKDWKFDRRMAAHLYRRAGFGATSEALDAAVKMGMEKAVKGILNPGAGEGGVNLGAFEKETAELGAMAMNTGNVHNLGAWWLHRMLGTPDQLQEKLVLFWHGHFATSAAKVTNIRMMKQHDELLRKYAKGSFRKFVQAMSKDPAMLFWLDSTTNRKIRPNENYAREVMELFCLGEGNYTEKDIKEVARAFTGWEVRRKKFVFNKRQHDEGEKRILGKVGNFNGDDAVRIILDQKAGPRFIAKKLCRYFVAEEPELGDGVVEGLAKVIRKHDYEMGPVMERLLMSRVFYSGMSVGRRVKSPVEMAVGLLRSLRGSGSTTELDRALARLGQGLYYPPNVKGWDGGRTWINSSTLRGRANLVGKLLGEKGARFGMRRNRGLSRVAAGAGVDGAEGLVRWVYDLLLAVEPPGDVTKGLVKLAKGIKDGDERVRKVVHAVGTLPEFQLA